MTAPQHPPRRRVLTAPPVRDSLVTAQLAAVSHDDVMRARDFARETCTALYNRFLNAGLDTRELIPRGDA